MYAYVCTGTMLTQLPLPLGNMLAVLSTWVVGLASCQLRGPGAGALGPAPLAGQDETACVPTHVQVGL
jgi:hypothetical protein